MSFKHNEFSAQSTPPSTHRIRTIRRQSSIGAYHDNPQPLPSTAHQTVTTQQNSVPISSSTSYYTNSPSPPHAGTATDHQHHHATATAQQQRPLETAHESKMEEDEQQHPPQQHLVHQSLETTNLAQCLTHSTLDSHSDILVLSRNQFEHMNAKLDQLTRRVQSLEQTLATDVRLILTLLQGQHQNNNNNNSNPVSVPGSLLVGKDGRPEVEFTFLCISASNFNLFYRYRYQSTKT